MSHAYAEDPNDGFDSNGNYVGKTGNVTNDPNRTAPAPTAPAYSTENADQQAAYDRRRAIEAGDSGQRMDHFYDNEARAFHSPGAAEYGKGAGGVQYLHDLAQGQIHGNDSAQAANLAAMQAARKGIAGSNVNLSTENAGLSAKDAATRGAQLKLLGMDRAAAMGETPSAAEGQTRLGMDSTLGALAGSAGAARGLSSLGGAQVMGAQGAGGAAGAAAYAGANTRANEIGSAIGMYGSLAGSVRDQDLNRLDLNTKNSEANAVQSDGTRVGNAQLLAGQAGLGTAQGATDLGWQDAAQHPWDQQLQNDQEMAAIQAGASADQIAAIRAKRNEQANNTRNLVNGGVTAGLTAVGTYYGGPVGGAAGNAAGQGIAAGTADWWK